MSLDAAPEAPSTPPADAPAPGTPPQAGGAPDAPPTPTATPQEIQAEKLAALRLKNAERKSRLEASSASTKAAREAMEARAKTLDEREGAVKRWNDNPLEAIQATGLSPKAALDALVREATLEGTPEGEIAKMRKEFAEQLSAHKAELAALKAEREAEKASAAEAHAVAEQTKVARLFVDTTLTAEKYAPLRAKRADGSPVYSEDEIVKLGNHFADQLSAAGKLGRDPLVTIADEILALHTREAARYGFVTQQTPAPDRAGKTVNGGRKPNTLSNQGSEAAPKKALSFEERVERAKQKFA